MLVVVVLATGALSAYAQSSDPGLVGWRFLSGQRAYCDNFYGSDHVYWCHSDLIGGTGSGSAPRSSHLGDDNVPRESKNRTS